ncbi:MAG: RDD family protein [Saprospiraceae bacterium]|nr:RDD family protein [Saprospiraceae bacterium]
MNWNIGMLECWSVGILECWNVGVLRKHYSIIPAFHYSRKAWKTIVLIFALNLWAVLAFAQTKASVHLDSTYILIGDQVQMQLFLDSAVNITNIKTDFSVFEDSLSKIEVVQHGEWNQVSLNKMTGAALWEQRVTLTSFEAGRYQLPDIPISFRFNGEKYSVTTTTANFLEVGTIAVSDSTQLAPIKGIIEEPTTLEDYLPYAIAVAALGLLIALVFLIIRLTRSKEIMLPPPIVLKPYEVALQKLGFLEDAHLWEKGDTKTFQTELTFILREYLEKQFHVPALENTTDEILTSLKRYGIAPGWQDKLRRLFQNADLVKFAKANLPVDIHNQSMKEAIHFVWETKPAPLPEEQEMEEVINSPEEAINKYKNKVAVKIPVSISNNNSVLSAENLVTHEEEVRYAGFWQRLVAAFIDGLIAIPVIGIIIYLRIYTANTSDIEDFQAVFVFSGAFMFAYGWLYFALFEWKKQATPGKMVMGLKVTGLDGRPISFGRATGRYFGKNISAAILYVGFIMVFFTKRKQALHDLMARCIVTRKSRYKYISQVETIYNQQ